MTSTVPRLGSEQSTAERRTLGGALVFVALVVLALFAVVYPVAAIAAVLGGLTGVLVGVRHRS